MLIGNNDTINTNSKKFLEILKRRLDYELQKRFKENTPKTEFNANDSEQYLTVANEKLTLVIEHIFKQGNSKNKHFWYYGVSKRPANDDIVKNMNWKPQNGENVKFGDNLIWLHDDHLRYGYIDIIACPSAFADWICGDFCYLYKLM